MWWGEGLKLIDVQIPRFQPSALIWKKKISSSSSYKIEIPNIISLFHKLDYIYFLFIMISLNIVIRK